MSSPKTPPCQKTATSAFNIFRGFSRKQKKVVNVSVIGGEGVGKCGAAHGTQAHTNLAIEETLREKFLVLFTLPLVGPLGWR